ncbi:hypothetical protein Ssi02_51020 [Sinosporangium siamense]|uniref:HTH luxR-type domain-containing protein n=1 Tax=Sinosporangium siamense TaxID=1367973 RepID=A0A919RMG8_9ACTN|nr:hypothetical protein Ssi02_51020 [Sinosporangium siamense]
MAIVGYLLKDIPPEELVAAIGKAARGETVLGDAAAGRLVAELVGAPTARLTERELEVARLVGAGASNREIAARLFITEDGEEPYLQHSAEAWAA